MTPKARIERLETQLLQPTQCPDCGGYHVRSWTAMAQRVVAREPVCACRPCCAWLADLQTTVTATH